jgi:hypothetical protein
VLFSVTRRGNGGGVDGGGGGEGVVLRLGMRRRQKKTINEFDLLSRVAFCLFFFPSPLRFRVACDGGDNFIVSDIQTIAKA